MQKLLNQRVADQAKPQAKPYQIHDTAVPGLVLRVQPTGTKVWKLIQNRKPRTLGRPPVMTYAMAATKAMAILQGDDPDEKSEPETTPEPEILTLDLYLERHYRPYLDAHHSRPNESFAYLNKFALGEKPLGEIRLADVETWRINRTRKGRASSTLNRQCSALKAALQRAVDWDLIETNPLARLKPLRVDKRAVVRYLSNEEDRRLQAALETVTPWLKAIVRLALNTGLRRGELWNLTWKDIDLKHAMLTVHGKGAKSGQTRHVPLNQAALDTLKDWRGDTVPMPTLPVFGRREFKKSWATLMRNAGIESFRFHDCRHSFASRLVMAGVPLNTVRELLGHGSIEMTLIYAHLAPDNLRQAVELLS